MTLNGLVFKQNWFKIEQIENKTQLSQNLIELFVISFY